MFSVDAYNGEGMQANTFCLTYDDGPGPLTLEIAEFLHMHGIRATFFVVGKYAVHYRETLHKMKELGHLIANHTYEHPDLPYYCSVDGDVQDQIIRTTQLIREYVDGSVIYFRAPYGKWSPEVANELNLNIRSSANHVGPVYWDIPGIDCYYWKNDKSVRETVDRYLDETEKHGKGIIVMHDDLADNDTIKIKNKTLELTKELIPMLLKKGSSFIRLDEIDSLKKTASQPDLFHIKNKTGNFLVYSGHPIPHLSFVRTDSSNQSGKWQIVFLNYGKIAIKASNGYFVTSDFSEKKEVFLEKTSVSPLEEFDLIPVRGNSFMLRTHNGYYLSSTSSKGAYLNADAEHMRQAEIFYFQPLNIATKKKIPLMKRLGLIKKRLLFIKSKIIHG